MRTVYTVLLTYLALLAHAQNKPELIIPLGHSDAIDSWAISPDGQYLATGSRDRTLKIWNIHYQKEIRTFRGHQGQITDICFGSNTQTIYSAGSDGLIIQWETSTGKILYIFDTRTENIHHEKIGSVRAIAVGKKKNILISAGTSEIAIWDYNTGKKLRTIPERAQAIALTPDESFFLSVYEGSLALWSAETGQLLRRFRRLPITYDYTKPEIYISKEGRYAFTRLTKSTGIQVWDVLSGESIRNLTKADKATKALTLNHDGSLIAVAYNQIWEKEYVEIYDGKSFNTISKIKRPEELKDNEIVALRFISENKLMIIHEHNGIAFLIDIHRPTAMKELHFSGLTMGVSDCAPDSISQSIYFGDYAGYIKNINLEKLEITLAAHKEKSPVNKLAMFSSRSNQLLAAYSDGSVRWWQTKNLKQIKSFGLHQDFITSLSILPHSDYFLSASWDQTIAVTSFSGKNKPTILSFHANPIRHVLYLPDSGKGFSADNNEIKKWNIFSRQALWSLNPKIKTNSLLYDPTQNKLLAGGGQLDFLDQDPDAAMIMIDAATGQQQVSYKGKELGFHTVQDVLWYKPRLYDRVLLATANGKIHRLDLLKSEIDFTRQGHIGRITAIRDGIDSFRFFFTSGTDGTLRIWNRDDANEILRVINFREPKQFAFMTPDGYFYASKETMRNLHYVSGLQVYTFDQFDLQFNRPDILLERIGKAPRELILAYRKAWEKRLRKMGVDPMSFEKERSFNVPTIILAANTETFVETSHPTHTISFVATDKLYNLDRLFVEVNGVPLYGLKGKSLNTHAKRSLQFTETIPLSSGKNIIKISVLNEKGVESLAEQIEAIYTPQTMIKPTLHIIAIGVSKFVQSDYNLTYADKDARDLVEVFRKFSGYNSIKVHLLTNEQATRSNILQLRHQLEKTNVDDRVIMFLASHGVLDDELDYYIATYDMDFSNPRNGGLRFDELENLLDSIPARNKAVFIDACHSGEVDKEEDVLMAANAALPNKITSRGFNVVKSKNEGIGLKNSFELMKELFADLRRNNGSVVISSASGKEYAYEGEQWKNGVFTYVILDGLKNKRCDANNDNSVTISELRDYVVKRVQELTNGKQNPTSRVENLENDFKVW